MLDYPFNNDALRWTVAGHWQYNTSNWVCQRELPDCGLRMLSTRYLEMYLQFTLPELRDIVLELRSLILSVAPDATENIRRTGLTYYDRELGGPVSGGICQISIHSDHVRLAFIHGAFLPDPKGLLEGDRKYKRYVRIHSYEHAPWDDLKDLITSSSHFDPYSLEMH